MCAIEVIRLIKVMADVIILSNPHLFAKLFTLFYRFFHTIMSVHSVTIKEHELGECEGTHKKWMRQPRNVFFSVLCCNENILAYRS